MKGQRCRPRRTPLPLPHNHPLPVTQPAAAGELPGPGEGGAGTATLAPRAGMEQTPAGAAPAEELRASLPGIRRKRKKFGHPLRGTWYPCSEAFLEVGGVESN